MVQFCYCFLLSDAKNGKEGPIPSKSPKVYRGYYMAARRYEISLRVLKPNHFTLIVFWCERRDLLCSHSKGDIFTCEDNMLFSQVKISSFCAKAHLVFHWCFYNKLWLALPDEICFISFPYYSTEAFCLWV